MHFIAGVITGVVAMICLLSLCRSASNRDDWKEDE